MERGVNEGGNARRVKEKKRAPPTPRRESALNATHVLLSCFSLSRPSLPLSPSPSHPVVRDHEHGAVGALEAVDRGAHVAQRVDVEAAVDLVQDRDVGLVLCFFVLFCFGLFVVMMIRVFVFACASFGGFGV